MTSLSSVSMTLPRPRPGLTLVLGVVLALASVSSSAAYAVGASSFLTHLCVAVPCLYFLCICIHDGVHGVFLKNRRIGNAAGFLLSLVIALPFPLLQSAHLKHHRVIAQRERRRGSVVDVDEHDPEAIVYEASLPALLLRLPFIPLWYLRSVRDMRASSVALTALHLGIVGMVLALLFEHGVDVMMVWAAPVLVAIGWFGFTTVYVPHGPHAQVLMRVFNAHSGWHHDHHRSPQFPFHQHAAVRALHLEHAHGDGARAHDPVVFFWARRVW